MYDDPGGWHNQFRQQITNRIDEDIFEPLYNETTGRVLKILLVMQNGNRKEAKQQNRRLERKQNFCNNKP